MRVLRMAREPSDDRTGVFTSGHRVHTRTVQVALYFTAASTPAKTCAACSRIVPKHWPCPCRCPRHLRAFRRRRNPAANCTWEKAVRGSGRNLPGSLLLRSRNAGRVYKVSKYDAEARAAQLSPQDRLLFHQQHSEPIMTTLQQWMQAQLTQHLVEPNSGLGKAITYFLRHWKRLTPSCAMTGAPLNNNICELASSVQCCIARTLCSPPPPASASEARRPIRSSCARTGRRSRPARRWFGAFHRACSSVPRRRSSPSLDW